MSATDIVETLQAADWDQLRVGCTPTAEQMAAVLEHLAGHAYIPSVLGVGAPDRVLGNEVVVTFDGILNNDALFVIETWIQAVGEMEVIERDPQSVIRLVWID